MSVFDEIAAERVAQDAEWGPSHDDQHTQVEWIALLCRHLGLAVDDGVVLSPRFRKQLIRLAALAVAAAESADRKKAGKVAGQFTAGSGF